MKKMDRMKYIQKRRKKNEKVIKLKKMMIFKIFKNQFKII